MIRFGFGKDRTLAAENGSGSFQTAAWLKDVSGTCRAILDAFIDTKEMLFY